ncbi:hypothetical protein V5N11_035872 [Cardamine amara subsp. amara]|uniref:Uncharacterized protein n=1 Tax=Cardamine amara subsp. amara TaxID=228776 RepID=A0ABD1B6C8_CARAN
MMLNLKNLRSKKMHCKLGPMDKFASEINPQISPLPTKQPNISDVLWKARLHRVHQYVARWTYIFGVPFHATATANDEFKIMLEAAAQFGSGVTPPSQYLLREPLLKEEVERVKDLLKTLEEE